MQNEISSRGRRLQSSQLKTLALLWSASCLNNKKSFKCSFSGWSKAPPNQSPSLPPVCEYWTLINVQKAKHINGLVVSACRVVRVRTDVTLFMPPRAWASSQLSIHCCPVRLLSRQISTYPLISVRSQESLNPRWNSGVRDYRKKCKTSEARKRAESVALQLQVFLQVFCDVSPA